MVAHGPGRKQKCSVETRSKTPVFWWKQGQLGELSASGRLRGKLATGDILHRYRGLPFLAPKPDTNESANGPC